MQNTDPPVRLPDRDLPLWHRLRDSFDCLDARMGRRPSNTLASATEYHAELAEALAKVGAALDAVGYPDIMDGWGSFPRGHSSYARNLLQITRGPTPEAVARLLAQDAKAPAIFDKMRRVVRQFADQFLEITRPASYAASFAPTGPMPTTEGVRPATDRSSAKGAYVTQDPFTQWDRTAREVFVGELADLNPRMPPIPLIVDARRTKLRTEAELSGRTAQDMLRDSGAALAEYEPRMGVFGRSVSLAMSYDGPMWWQLSLVGRGARLQSLRSQLESSREASAELLRLARHYCPSVAEPLPVGSEPMPPTWEELLQIVDEHLTALCPEGRPMPPVGFLGQLLVAVKTPDELAEWINLQMFIREQARWASQSPQTGETGVLRNAYCLARSLRLTGLPSEPAGALTASDEEIYVRNLLMALDSLAPTGESDVQTPKALDSWRERKRKQEDEESQRTEQRQHAQRRLEHVSERWEQARRDLEESEDGKASAESFVELARALEAEGLFRCFDDPGPSHSAFPPDEADARTFVADLLRRASRGDREGILRDLRHARAEDGFLLAVKKAIRASRQHTIRLMKDNLARELRCFPGDPCLDIEAADTPSVAASASDSLDALFAADEAERVRREVEDRAKVEAERRRQEVLAENEKVRNIIFTTFRHALAFVVAKAQAGDVDSSRSAFYRELATKFGSSLPMDQTPATVAAAIAEAGLAADHGRGPARLDAIPVPGTPDNEHYRPLRFLVCLLRLGRDGKQDEIARHLARLPESPTLQRFLDWFAPVADALCGYQPIGDGIAIPQELPLAPGRCDWEAHCEVSRALGMPLLPIGGSVADESDPVTAPDLPSSGRQQPRAEDFGEGTCDGAPAPESVPLPPELQGMIGEIRRAAAELKRVVHGWEIWVWTVGTRIETLPPYPDGSKVPPVVINGMTQAIQLKKRAELALHTLYGHGCLPPTLRGRSLKEAQALFPLYPQGPIEGERDKQFVVSTREALPVLSDIGSELARLLEQLDFAPLSVIYGTPRPGEQDETGNPSGTAGGRDNGTASGKLQEECPALSNRQIFILGALLEFEAFDSDSRRTTEEVAARAEGLDADPNKFKMAVAGLRKADLVGTKTGSGGGIWLTRTGRERAEHDHKR